MIGAFLGAAVGYLVHLVALQKGAGTDLLGNPWATMTYGALLGGTALMGLG